MQVGGRTIHVARSGAGPVVIALHSTGSSGRQWGGLAARLEDRFTVVRPDWIGCGGSADWESPEPFDLEADRDVLRAVLDDTGPAHLVGHSYGGSLALWAALESPGQVRSVAVYEPLVLGILHSTRDPEGLAHLRATLPTSFFDPALEGSPEWLRHFVDWWQGAGTWDALSEAHRAPFLRSASKIFHEVRHQAEDRTPHRAYLALSQPLLVLHGTETPAAARRASALLGEVVGARTVALEGAGHMGPLTHAKVVNAELETHLDEAEALTG